MKRKVAERSASLDKARSSCPPEATAALAGVAGGLAGAVVGGNVGSTNGAAVAAAAIGATLGVVAAEALTARSEPESLPQVVDYLQQHLGAITTSYLSGADDPAVIGLWAEGKSHPGELSTLRLKAAREATRYIVDAYGDTAAKSWFLGMNGLLNEISPARVLRYGQKPDDWDLVVPAARAYVEHAR